MVEGLENARLKGEIDLLYPKVVKGLNRLPSAQAEIIRCKDCRWYGFYSCKLHGNSWMRNGNGYCDRAERREK